MTKRGQMRDTLGANGPVALTGATGFLGRAVLAQLLTTTEVRIIALVRATSGDEADRRGRETLLAALDRDPTEAETTRVAWVRADLEEARLGLSSASWDQLAATVGDVLHCAASIRFDLDLEDAQRINVDGTATMLDLAREARAQGHFGCFHHVSTAYVAGRTKRLTDADHLASDRAGNYRNSYERTKARAERLLRNQQEVPVAIYRPSIIGGATDSGRTDNWNVLYVPMRMIAKGQLPVLPVGGDALVDTVGIDYVARGIVHLAGRDRGGFIGHHLTAGESFTVRQFVDSTRRIARTFDRTPSAGVLVGPARWKLLKMLVALAAGAPKRARRIRCWGRLAACGLRTAGPYEAYSAVSSRFDNRRERLLLEAVDITMPDPQTYLETIGSYAIGTDFGRGPAVATPTAGPTTNLAISPDTNPTSSPAAGPRRTPKGAEARAATMAESAVAIVRSRSAAVAAPVAS